MIPIESDVGVNFFYDIEILKAHPDIEIGNSSPNLNLFSAEARRHIGLRADHDRDKLHAFDLHDG